MVELADGKELEELNNLLKQFQEVVDCCDDPKGLSPQCGVMTHKVVQREVDLETEKTTVKTKIENKEHRLTSTALPTALNAAEEAKTNAELMEERKKLITPHKTISLTENILREMTDAGMMATDMIKNSAGTAQNLFPTPTKLHAPKEPKMGGLTKTHCKEAA